MGRFKLEKKSILPDAYQEIEYIESTGTQYINLGLRLNNNTKIELDATITKTGTQALWSSRANVGQISYTLLYSSSKLRFDYRFITTGSTDITYPINQRLKIVADKNKLYVDDILKVTHTAETFTTGRDMYLMTTYDNNASNYRCSMKLYKCNVYNDNVLVRNLIPCYRKSDSVVGLYEAVNDVFYTNSGTGTFSQGNDVNVHNIIETDRYCLELTLPEGFTPIPYIESTGTQYIDTGIQINSNNIIEASFATTNDVTTPQCLFGGREGFEMGQYSANIANGELYFHYEDTTGSIATYTGMQPNTPYNVEFGLSNITVNNNTQQFTHLDFTNEQNIYIFRQSQLDLYYASIRLFRYKIKSSTSQLLRDFIPAIRDSDNTFGLYEKVNGVFYTNSGTGVFTYTQPIPYENLPSAYQQLDCIAANGVQYINTGYVTDGTPIGIEQELYFLRTQEQRQLSGADGLYGGMDTNGNADQTDVYILDSKYHTLKSEFTGTTKRFYVDGSLEYAPQTTYFPNASAYVFSISTTNNFPCHARCRKYTIYNFNTGKKLVELVPCYRKSDNVLGMYDKVTDTFKTNAGSGTLVAGNPVYYTPTVSKYEIITTNRYCLEKVKILPDAYQQVEYIESTGTQYIDTGFTANQNTDVELDYSVTETTNNVVMGGGSLSPYRYSIWVANSPSPLTLAWHYGQEDTGAILVQELNTKYSLRTSGTKIYVNDILIHTVEANNFTAQSSFYLFARHTPSGVDRQSKSRIYKCKIYNNGISARNFVPCYRKSDNVIGMYNLVNDVFYTNAGSGTFLKGNDINYEIIKIL